MPFEIQIAVAKTNKYASRESGDTAEVVERPTGGLSVILVDGQGSGQAAKSLSLLVSAKAVALLKEGARDGAVARVVHDYLHAFRQGRVSATLEILSVDLASKTVVSTRNSHTPILLRRGDEYELRPSTSSAIGIRRHTKPAVDQFDAEPGLRMAIFSDGVISAGERYRCRFDPLAFANERLRDDDLGAQPLADALLAEALAADQGRANDDMTVVTLALGPRHEYPHIRRLGVSLPLP
jgi:serine phosphatase RsbU (regulator of sigma subunit)